MDYYDLFLEIVQSSEETSVDFFISRLGNSTQPVNVCQIWIKHCIVSSLAFSLHALS